MVDHFLGGDTRRPDGDVYLVTGSHGHIGSYIVEELCKAKDNIQIISSSSFYETEPWGIIDQPLFLNMALHLRTRLAADKLLQCIFAIEKKLKRERVIINGPRTIDIDILIYGHAIIDRPGLQVPHPGMHKRTTVLLPLIEIASKVVHPVFRKTMAELLEEIR